MSSKEKKESSGSRTRSKSSSKTAATGEETKAKSSTKGSSSKSSKLDPKTAGEEPKRSSKSSSSSKTSSSKSKDAKPAETKASEAPKPEAKEEKKSEHKSSSKSSSTTTTTTTTTATADVGAIDALKKELKDKDSEISRLKALVESLQKANPEAAREQAEADDMNSTEISFQPKKGKNVRINSEWKGISAGGSMDNLTWRYNPQIFLWPSRTATISITLSQPSEGTPTGIGYYVFEASQPTARRLLVDNKQLVAQRKFVAAVSAEASFSFKKSRVPYIIVPCTKDPDNEMPFTVTIAADSPVTAQLISKEQEWPQPTLLGEWSGETAGGCGNEDTVVNNTQYLLNIKQQMSLSILLLQTKFLENFDSIGMYLLTAEAGTKQKITESDVFEDGHPRCVAVVDFQDSNQAFLEVNLKPGLYVLVPCTFEAGSEAPFSVMFMSDTEMAPIVELADAAVLSVNGDWEGETAGGCLNNPLKWRANNQYALSVKEDCQLTIKLKQTSSLASELNSVGFYVFKGGRRVIKPKKEMLLKKSKFGKIKDVHEKIKFKASEEPYIIVPCTFDAEKEGSYALSVQADDTSFLEFVTLELLNKEQEMAHAKANGAWEGATAGGCLDYSTWRQNPQFCLEVAKDTTVTIFLTCLVRGENDEDEEKEYESLAPGFYVVNAPTNMNLCVELKKEDVILKAPFSKGSKEVSKSMEFGPGRYNIIPCQFTTSVHCKFELNVYSTESESIKLTSIPAGVLTLEGEWTDQNSGGCINDMQSWLKNPHLFLAVKQQTEIAMILIQNPNEDVPENLNDLLEIGMYVTNSDGDGNPKTNEETDLIAKSPFSPDKDVVYVGSLPACHWPYVVTPCTFQPGIRGKFKMYLIMDHENLEYLEFSHEPMNINPAEVVGAGEDPHMREIRRRFKPIASQTVELVKLTESEEGIPEFLNYVGRTLLQAVVQFQASIVSWGEGTEPQWWLDGYEEEVVAEDAEDAGEPATVATGGPPLPPGGGPPPPPPPPPKLPPINFSKPPKLGMIETGQQSGMTSDMIAELEEKPKTKLFIDELLIAVKGGLANLKKVEPAPPKPTPVEDPLICAFFNMEILNSRRAAIEGLHDKPEDDDDWDDDDWDP